MNRLFFLLLFFIPLVFSCNSKKEKKISKKTEFKNGRWISTTDSTEGIEIKNGKWIWFNKKGETELHRVEAFDKVKVTTPKDTALSQRAVYNAKSGIATLSGDVQIIRDGNRLTGCSAEVNLNTGISRLRTCDMYTKGGTNRVQGVVWPQKRKKQKK